MPTAEPQHPKPPASAKTRKTWSRVAIAAGALAWVAGVAWGLQKIQVYSTTPGAAAVAPSSWPGSAMLAPKAGQPTLVMFIHPQCSCTRASLAELQSILDQAQGSLSAWVVVLKPSGMPEEWTRSSTWESARQIAGVTVVEDFEGTEADRFGASTSGDTVLYDAQGRLQFHGGITAARGHVGNNTGRERVVSLINTGDADSHTHEVYGCGLHDPHTGMDHSQMDHSRMDGDTHPSP